MMTKKLPLILTFLLLGCGGTTTPDLPSEATIDTKIIRYQDLDWQVQIPSTWNLLAPQNQALLMAQNGDENLAILERSVTDIAPKEQILGSAKQQFFNFKMIAEKNNTWQFSGKLAVTSPERIFWQKVEMVPNKNTFLLASCSQHAGSPSESFCESILRSWEPLFEVSS